MDKNTFPFLLFCLLTCSGFAQAIHHWESAVLAENVWRYRPGNTEPPSGWNAPGFDDTFWGEGEGGVGYGDNDDNTTISPSMSLYLRKEFEIIDSTKIEEIILHADYDDAFVAYLNGVEIARSNIGVPGDLPPFDEPSNTDHEAQLYQGGLPEAFPMFPAALQGIWKNGTNTLAFQVHNTGANSSDLSAIFFLSFGINGPSNDYQPLPDWFANPFESSNLPLLLINTFGQGIPDEPKIDGHLGVIDNGQGQRNFLADGFNGYDGNIGIEIRGASSQMFPKKNYSFETRLENGDNNNVPLLGMPEENDWVLHGPYSDKSLLRNVLSYHIGWQTDRYTPRTRWCELFINGQYRGVYMLTERIKRDANRVDIAKLKPEDVSGDELTGGYIFQIDRDKEGVDDGWHSAFSSNVFYAYHDPAHDELVPAQKTYLKDYISGFEEAIDSPAMSDVYDQYVDIESFVDYLLASEIFKHIDGYKLSFYMFKKKDSNGGKIHFGPLWDLNLAYGNFDFGRDPGPEGWSYLWATNAVNRPFWLLKLMSLDTVRNQVNCRWQELRQQGWHTDSLLQFIDDNAELIEEARIRNFARWPVLGIDVWPNSFVGYDYGEELDFLKNWLTERLNWMDDNMVGICNAVATENLISPNIHLQVFPNPFQDEVVFYFENTNFEKGEIIFFDAVGGKLGGGVFQSGKPKTFYFKEEKKGFYFYKLMVDERAVAFGKLVKN